MKYDEKQNLIYYISDENGIHNLWKYNLVNDEKVQVTDEDQNINDYWLEPNDNIVAIDYNGNERNQLYRLENQNDLNQLIIDGEYFHHYGLYDENQDGYYIIRNHYDSSLFELCLIKRNEEPKVLYDFDAPVVILSSIENNQLLLTYENSNIMKQLYIFNTDSLKVEKLPLESSRFLTFNNIDGKDYAYCLSDWETGFINIYKMDLEDWSYQRLTSFSWDIEHIVWSERYDQATVIVNENGCSKLYNFDVDTDDITEIEFRNDGVIHSIQKRDENELFILFSSVDVPHCIVNYNLQSNTYSTLVENSGNAAAINWNIHSYKSFDGLDVPYFMYESENVGEKPTLIYIHGGPESDRK